MRNKLPRRTVLKSVGGAVAAGSLLTTLSTPALAGENYANSDKDAVVGAPTGTGDVAGAINQYPSYGDESWYGALLEDVVATRFDHEHLRDVHLMLWDDDLGETLDCRNDAAGSEVSYASSRVPEVTIHNWYQFGSGYWADTYQDVLVSPNRPALHVRNRVTFDQANAHSVYTLANPAVDSGGSAGDGDEAWKTTGGGYDLLVATDGSYYYAMGQHRPSTGKTGFDGQRIGVEGGSGSDKSAWTDVYEENDGWITTNTYNSGNVDTAVGLWVSTDTDITFETVFGFGTSEQAAIDNAVASLDAGYAAEASDHETAWENWHGSVRSSPTGDATADAMYELSLTAMKCTQDSTGPTVAGLFEPHGDQYTYVWPRDQTIMIQAWLSAGAHDEALAALSWLDDAQIKSDYWWDTAGPLDGDGDDRVNRKGTWWQNYHVDGTKNWEMIQIDETAGPIYAHWLCWQEIDGGSSSSSILTDHYAMSKLAAEFMIERYDNGYGMVDKHNDPWEEEWGYSSEGCAAAIAGLRCMAELADAYGESSFAQTCRDTADEWASNFYAYLYKSTSYGDVVVSVDSPEWDASRDDKPDAAAFMAHWPWNVMDAADAELSSTLDATDHADWVASNTPCLDRYPGDDYTPSDSDEDGGWPLCEAYADVARWQEGRDPNAVSDYVFSHAEQWRTAGGLLPERVDGDGNVRWNSHLNWSQAMFVLLTECHRRGSPFGYAPGT